MKALVIQPAFIGDAVISIALAEALRSIDPKSDIIYLVRPETATLLSYAPAISKVISFDKYGEESGEKGIKKKAAELNSEKFDIVFCLHSSKRSIELVRRLSVPIKVGITEDDAFTNYGHSKVGDDAAMKAVRMAQGIYPQIDISTIQKLVFPLELIPESVRSLPRPIFGIAPGSVWKTKRWKASRYVDLAESLLLQGKSVILLGLKSEIQHQIDKFDNLLNNNKLNLLSKMSLEETAAIISYIDLLISNDSAPVHIAIATQTPLVTIFGPTVPEFGFAPRTGCGELVAIKDLWCRPCTSHGSNECPIHTHECMERITVDRVMQSLPL